MSAPYFVSGRYGDFIKLNLNITKAFYTDHRNGVRFSNPIIVIALVIVSVVPTGFQFENSVEQSMDDFSNDSTTRMWKILPLLPIKKKRECIVQNAPPLKFYRSQLSRFFVLFCFCCACCCCFRRMNSRTERTSASSWSRFATSRLLSCISIGLYFSP